MATVGDGTAVADTFEGSLHMSAPRSVDHSTIYRWEVDGGPEAYTLPLYPPATLFSNSLHEAKED